MNLHISTKQLNESGKLFFTVGPENDYFLFNAQHLYGKNNVAHIGTNWGLYGRNYDLYILVNKTGIYHIICGCSNFPKRRVKWSREDLEKALAAD